MTLPDDPASMPGQGAPVALAGLSLDIDISNSCLGTGDWPHVIKAAVHAALAAGLSGPLPPVELYIELVNNQQSQLLNRDYRGKDKPTNVLSFPATEPDDLPGAMKLAAQGGPPMMLGDLIVASAVIAHEATEQNKSVSDHLSHLIVHGVLHLLGYDHIRDDEASVMENMEREILETLGIKDPYRMIET
jgi:probable rRNA maturation factor